MQRPILLDTRQASYAPPAFSFVTPRVLPGSVMLAFVVTSNAASVISPGWEEVGSFQADSQILIMRHVVDGTEPELMTLVIDDPVTGSCGCQIVTYSTTGTSFSLAGVALTDAVTEFPCPGANKTSAQDVYLGIALAESSTVEFATPAGVVPVANVSDGEAASFQLLLFAAGTDLTVVPAQTVTAHDAQPGLAAALVIPAAP